MHSSLYKGWVRHRRRSPAANAFSYRLFMVYIDLAELPAVFDGSWLWSARRPALAWFRRGDYLGPSSLPLDEAVRASVQAATGKRPDGPVRMLTHLRYFGYCMNPVTFYYCFDRSGEHLRYVLAEINNTPWDERHSYVLDVTASQTDGGTRRWRMKKCFHVSPFMPMDMDYDWRFGEPGRGLQVHMENLLAGERIFDATLVMRREAITPRSLNLALLSQPLITLKVVVMIYWQAFRLLLKRVPFFTHPARRGDADTASPEART